jgi:ankyrin repeat protein
MNYRKALWIAGVLVLGVLIVGSLLPPGNGLSPNVLRKMRSENELRQFAFLLISYAEDHCDNFPPSIGSLSDDSIQQSGLDPEALSRWSYIATKDRRHLIVFERPDTTKDHTVAYLDLEMSGKWTRMFTDGLNTVKVNHVPEQQFVELVSGLSIPTTNQSPSDKLIAAAESGDSQTIQAILGEGVSIDEEDQRGWTALTVAVQEGQSGIVAFLISNGAKIDLRDNFGMGRTALMRASALGYESIVKILLDHGVDIHSKREDGSSALTDALPYPTIVVRLIAAGADCNEQIRQDWSPLIAACSGGYAESARLLIEHGASLKRDGLTALDAAASNGQADAINALLEKGLSVDKKVLGECLSSAYSHPQAMKTLISAGADLNAKCTCPGGRTALMISAINGCPETVDLLIGAGADVNAKDDNGHTALDLMLADTRTEWMPRSSVEKARLLGIADVLRKSGAKESGLYVEWPEPR